ncbi:hypothetical protein E0W68_10965 [Flavobacterium salilacus subsp. salilacus]|uniref:hypothetical protein n=1 Tax=Flavobacterium TaxID=237 RepID=UPI001074F5CA|nr:MULTISPECIES: hypothetical protein [Flavobacterium]KAF2517484.1 hypothetical protein E0W68_10965 [Flavobacterium salilacus subsp. salilacus]MBE1615629.1 hypothetical protein [Flavobacterium sp. SaA2.13]
MKMKMYSIMLFLLTAISLQAQSFGAAGLEVEGNFNPKNAVYYDWLRHEGTNDVTMKFPQTPKGIEDAMNIAQQMLVKNELFIDKPDEYNNVEVEDFKNNSSQQLHTAIQNQKAKINLAWYSPDGSTLHLFLGQYSYEINIYKAYKL